MHLKNGLLEVARKLVTLHGNVYFGPVTDIFHARVLAVAILSADGVRSELRQSLLDQWERVTFRIFGLYRSDARKEVGEYVRLARKIVAEIGSPNLCDQIMRELISIGAKYNIEDAVIAGLSRQDCYAKPEICRYVLWQYEEHLAQNAGLGATINEQDRIQVWKRHAVDSIEHIFPQNPSAERAWNGKMTSIDTGEEPVANHVDRIGNLLLLPIALNQQARTSAFQHKKGIYARHSLRSIGEVCHQSDWTLDTINAREARIVDWAKTRWCDITYVISPAGPQAASPSALLVAAPQVEDEPEEQAPITSLLVRNAESSIDDEEVTPAQVEAALHGDPKLTCVLATYEVFKGTGLRDPKTAPLKEVTSALVGIVEREGPATVRTIMDRYRVGADYGRLKGPTRDALLNKLNMSINSGSLVRTAQDDVDSLGDVIALPSLPTVRVRERGPRKLIDIPIEEIAGLIRLLDIVGEDEPIIVTEVLRAYGLRRRTPDAVSRLAQAINMTRAK